MAATFVIDAASSGRQYLTFAGRWHRPENHALDQVCGIYFSVGPVRVMRDALMACRNFGFGNLENSPRQAQNLAKFQQFSAAGDELLHDH